MYGFLCCISRWREREERIDLECAYPPLTGGQSRSGFKKEGIDLVFSMAALLKVCVSFDC